MQQYHWHRFETCFVDKYIRLLSDKKIPVCVKKWQVLCEDNWHVGTVKLYNVTQIFKLHIVKSVKIKKKYILFRGPWVFVLFSEGKALKYIKLPLYRSMPKKLVLLSSDDSIKGNIIYISSELKKQANRFEVRLNTVYQRAIQINITLLFLACSSFSVTCWCSEIFNHLVILDLHGYTCINIENIEQPFICNVFEISFWYIAPLTLTLSYWYVIPQNIT